MPTRRMLSSDDAVLDRDNDDDSNDHRITKVTLSRYRAITAVYLLIRDVGFRCVNIALRRVTRALYSAVIFFYTGTKVNKITEGYKREENYITTKKVKGNRERERERERELEPFF